MEMKITILGSGTSTGVPVIGCKCHVCSSEDERDKRLRSSILWEVDGKHIVIDAGPDFRSQMIRSKCDTVDAILVTHMHYDHVGGLDDVRGLNYSMRRSIDVYAEELHAKAIRTYLPYVFVEDKYPGVPKLNLNIIECEPLDVAGVRVEPLRVMHAKMPILGYKIGNWAYITDASSLPDETLEKIDGIDTLVINALRDEPHMSHFSIRQAIDVAQKVGARRTYLTHIGHEFGRYAEKNDTLPEGIEMAYDGLVIE